MPTSRTADGWASSSVDAETSSRMTARVTSAATSTKAAAARGSAAGPSRALGEALRAHLSGTAQVGALLSSEGKEALETVVKKEVGDEEVGEQAVVRHEAVAQEVVVVDKGPIATSRTSGLGRAMRAHLDEISTSSPPQPPLARPPQAQGSSARSATRPPPDLVQRTATCPPPAQAAAAAQTLAGSSTVPAPDPSPPPAPAPRFGGTFPTRFGGAFPSRTAGGRLMPPTRPPATAPAATAPAATAPALAAAPTPLPAQAGTMQVASGPSQCGAGPAALESIGPRGAYGTGSGASTMGSSSGGSVVVSSAVQARGLKQWRALLEALISGYPQPQIAAQHVRERAAMRGARADPASDACGGYSSHWGLGEADSLASRGASTGGSTGGRTGGRSGGRTGGRTGAGSDADDGAQVRVAARQAEDAAWSMLERAQAAASSREVIFDPVMDAKLRAAARKLAPEARKGEPRGRAKRSAMSGDEFQLVPPTRQLVAKHEFKGKTASMQPSAHVRSWEMAELGGLHDAWQPDYVAIAAREKARVAAAAAEEDELRATAALRFSRHAGGNGSGSGSGISRGGGGGGGGSTSGSAGSGKKRRGDQSTEPAGRGNVGIGCRGTGGGTGEMRQGPGARGQGTGEMHQGPEARGQGTGEMRKGAGGSGGGSHGRHAAQSEGDDVLSRLLEGRFRGAGCQSASNAQPSTAAPSAAAPAAGTQPSTYEAAGGGGSQPAPLPPARPAWSAEQLITMQRERESRASELVKMMHAAAAADTALPSAGARARLMPTLGTPFRDPEMTVALLRSGALGAIRRGLQTAADGRITRRDVAEKLFLSLVGLLRPLVPAVQPVHLRQSRGLGRMLMLLAASRFEKPRVRDAAADVLGKLTHIGGAATAGSPAAAAPATALPLPAATTPTPRQDQRPPATAAVSHPSADRASELPPKAKRQRVTFAECAAQSLCSQASTQSTKPSSAPGAGRPSDGGAPDSVDLTLTECVKLKQKLESAIVADNVILLRDILGRMQAAEPPADILKSLAESKLSKLVASKLAKHSDATVSSVAAALVKSWKALLTAKNTPASKPDQVAAAASS